MKMVLTIRGAVRLAAALSVIVPGVARAQDSVATARRVFATASLAAEEYGVGVVGGRVVSVAEVEEARLFIGEARKAAMALPPALAVASDSALAEMFALVQRTAAPEAVDAVADALGQVLTSGVGASLEPVPEWAPSIARGRELFAQACASCHGASGRGDGPGAAGQEPPPANLTDATLLADRSPLDFYRRVTLGVAGTSMAGFESALSEADRWAVALYASTLRLPEPRGSVPEGLAAFARSATHSDLQLIDSLGHRGPPDAAVLARVAAIRQAGAADDAARMAAAFGRVRKQLDDAVALADAGQPEEAGSTALAAYMTFEALERDLRPRNPGLASELEQAFTGFRLDAQGGESARELRAAEVQLVTLLDRAERQLGAERRPFDLFLQSFILLVREGLEAILIVGALLAFLTKIGASRRARDVKAGIGAAIAASLLTAVLIETVFQLTPADQEVLEGATMLLATGVLFSVSYWLLTKLEVAKWNAFVRGKVEEAVAGGSSLALVDRDDRELLRSLERMGGGAGGALRGDPAIRRAPAAQAVLRGHQRVPLLDGLHLRRPRHRRAPGRRVRLHDRHPVAPTPAPARDLPHAGDHAGAGRPRPPGAGRRGVGVPDRAAPASRDAVAGAGRGDGGAGCGRRLGQRPPTRSGRGRARARGPGRPRAAPVAGADGRRPGRDPERDRTNQQSAAPRAQDGQLTHCRPQSERPSEPEARRVVRVRWQIAP
jgi:high-affinity iron transporter